MRIIARARHSVSWITAVGLLLVAAGGGCAHHSPSVMQNGALEKPAPEGAMPCLHGGPPGDAGSPCPLHAAMEGRPCGAGGPGGEAEPCEHGAPGLCAKGGGVRWIDLTSLAASLPPAPIDVVFDVDDTILFTSPGFQWGVRTYGERIAKAGTPDREEDMASDEERRNFREFWTKMNNDLDQWSVRKWSGGELVKLHKARGDRIHFVTKRVKTGTEKLTQLIAKTFDLAGMEPVIFTDRTAKTPFFRQVHAQVSYGDSDGDIRDSIAAGARPVRVTRARNSVNEDPTHDGAFGEEVLIDSAD